MFSYTSSFHVNFSTLAMQFIFLRRHFRYNQHIIPLDNNSRNTCIAITTPFIPKCLLQIPLLGVPLIVKILLNVRSPIFSISHFPPTCLTLLIANVFQTINPLPMGQSYRRSIHPPTLCHITCYIN